MLYIINHLLQFYEWRPEIIKIDMNYLLLLKYSELKRRRCQNFSENYSRKTQTYFNCKLIKTEYNKEFTVCEECLNKHLNNTHINRAI